MIGRIVEIASDGRSLSLYRGFLIVKARQEDEWREIGRVPLDNILALVCNAHGLTYTNNVLVALAERGIPFVLCADNHKPVGMIWCVWPLRIPQFGHEKCPPRWGILLASKNPFIPVNMLVAPSDSSVSLQPA